LTVSFRHTSAITDTTPAASLAMTFNDQANLIKLERAKPVGQLQLMKVEGIDLQGTSASLNAVPSDDLADDRVAPAGQSFVPLALANQSTVTILAQGGDDLITLDVSRSVTGLTSLTVDGGAGTDRLLGDDFPANVTTAFPAVEQVVADAAEDEFIQELYN